MNVTAAPPAAPARRSARTPRGFVPSYPGETPTLGWGILEHAYAHLPSPRDEREPFVFTDEQAQHVLAIYALDEHGRRVYRRVHEEQAKGWGKSPFAAALAIEEFTGPVCFDGWDAHGQPVGVSWGVGGRPAPWVQVAAVSEDQTANTYNALYGMLTANGGRNADDLRIDDGRTRLYRKDMPSAFLERVTASAGSREGQPITFAVADEPQLWVESNHGVRLALTILRNLSKMSGWGLFTGNAPVVGLGSVSELFGQASSDVLMLARRPSVVPQRDWTREQMREALVEVYGDAWWTDPDRLLADIADPAQPWRDSLRFFFNLRGDLSADQAWVEPDVWADMTTDTPLAAQRPLHVVVTIAHDHRSAAIAMAQHVGDHVVLRVEHVEGDGDVLVLADVERRLLELKSRYAAPVRQAVPRPSRPDGIRAVPGPEVGYHGAFFEGSAQRLRARGVQTIDIVDSPERRAAAAETFHALALEGRIEHEDDPVLAHELAMVHMKEVAKGWQVVDAGPAIRAAIHVVHRAALAPVRVKKPAQFRSM